MGVELIVRACALVGARPTQVLSSKDYPDAIALVIDWGVAGGKKYIIPHSDLAEPEAEPEPVKRGRGRPKHEHGATELSESGR